MRKPFCDAMVSRATNPKLVFLTGDLGYMALEPLQAALGKRFINAGVAEQNMISVAAALAKEGMEAWAYSIAPFCYARPFEQIRNDIAFHDLPVKLVGNGGGYGYGVMGPTHHAIEDYGVLLTLPAMQVFVPVFDEDIKTVVGRVADTAHPAYLRLGRGELSEQLEAPPYAPWRQLIAGDGMVVIAVGPIAGSFLGALSALPQSNRPNLWALAELPVLWESMPAPLQAQLQSQKRVCVVEEHVARGGVGAELALLLVKRGIAPQRFFHLCAQAHIYERYGSQTFLRKQSQLDVAALLSVLKE
jgi:transketolase